MGAALGAGGGGTSTSFTRPRGQPRRNAGRRGSPRRAPVRSRDRRRLDHRGAGPPARPVRLGAGLHLRRARARRARARCLDRDADRSPGPDEGEHSPWAPAFGLLGALVVGALLARLFEAFGAPGAAAGSARCRGSAPPTARSARADRRRGARGRVDPRRAGGPERDLPDPPEVQRSAILQRLNTVLPPSGPLLNSLRRLDPFPRIDGPEATSRRPGRHRARSRGAAGGRERGEGPRDRVRARRLGLGLGRRRRAWSSPTRTSSPGARHAGAAAGAEPASRPRRPLRPAQRRRGPARPGLDAPALPLGGRPSRARRRRSSASRSTARSTCAPGGSATRGASAPPDAYGRGPVERR